MRVNNADDAQTGGIVMTMRSGLFNLGLVALFLCLVPGCGGDDDPADPGGGTPSDTTPPAKVLNLFPGHVAGTTVTLSWTAPGDDGDTGTAAEYDLRWSGVPITDATWGACNRATGEPTPLVGGTNQVAAVDVGLIGTFHFALKTADEVPNWSELSNSTMAEVTGGGFVINQLTTEGHNIQPNLDDGVVVWVSNNTASGQDLFIANIRGASPTPSRITDNGGEKNRPNNHGSERIVWEQKDAPGKDREIWVYDKYAIPRFQAFTDNDVDDLYPDLDQNGNFAWIQGPTVFEEVHYWNESMHSQSVISHDWFPSTEWINFAPSADGGQVVWRTNLRGGSEHRITLWDGSLTNLEPEIAATLSLNYSLQNGGIAYEHHGTSPPTIKYWDGIDTIDVGTGYNPSLFDGRIAFEKWGNTDWEIWYWDGATTHRITDNQINDTSVSLSGNLIAWSGATSGGGGHIYWVDVGK